MKGNLFQSTLTETFCQDDNEGRFGCRITSAGFFPQRQLSDGSDQTRPFLPNTSPELWLYAPGSPPPAWGLHRGGARSSHLACVAQQRGREVSAGGAAAFHWSLRPNSEPGEHASMSGVSAPRGRYFPPDPRDSHAQKKKHQSVWSNAVVPNKWEQFGNLGKTRIVQA